MANHIVVRVYPSLKFIANSVLPEHLENHIQYNKDFRPGVSLFVDGKLVNTGIGFRAEMLKEAEEIAKSVSLNVHQATIPYR